MNDIVYGVIDIGSNSVRLMIADGKGTRYKKTKITKLAEGFGEDSMLKQNAIERTVDAIRFFYEEALLVGANEIYAFATAAVRRAANKTEFTDKVYKACGIKVDVISGEKEAAYGASGALDGDGGLIDIGGASSEITVVKSGSPVYTYSLDLGTVKLKNACGQDKDKLTALIDEKIKLYGDVPKSDFTAIGGTATTVCALLQELEPYDPKKVEGYIIKKKELSELSDKLFTLDLEEKERLKGLQKERADVIAGGTLLLLKIMEKLSVYEIKVSEKDNLEGYLKAKTEKK